MSLSKKEIPGAGTDGASGADSLTSSYIARFFAETANDLEQRAAVFTDPGQPDNPIVYATKAFYAVTGFSPPEVIGQNCRILQGPDTDPATIAAIRAAIRELQPLTIDILNYRKNGSAFWNRLRIRPFMGDDNTVERFIGLQNPIEATDVRPDPIVDFVD